MQNHIGSAALPPMLNIMLLMAQTTSVRPLTQAMKGITLG